MYITDPHLFFLSCIEICEKRAKFAQQEYLRSKAEKMSIIMEFCIFELVEVSNFSLNW